MAFTKVLGPGIHTQANILSHNINSSGIITATKFVGPITGGGGDFNAGIVTCTTLDVNGSGDISGNLVLGGNLTVNGTTTTLDTNLIGVDRVEVTTAGTNVAVAVTHNGTGDLVRLYDGTSQKVTVDDEGKIGIGTPSPDFIQHNYHATDNVLALFESGDEAALISFQDNSSTNNTQVWLGAQANDFRLAAGGAERLRIKSDGKVGVGTVTPGKTLDIWNTSAAADLRLKTTANSFNSLILDSARAKDTQFAIIDGRWNGNDVARIQFVTGSDDTNYDDGFMAFHTRKSGESLSERLRITSDGNVGINQSNPTSDLEVAGVVGTGATIFVNAPTHNTNVASIAMFKLGYKHSGGQAVGYFKLTEGGGNSFDGNLTVGVPYNQGSGNFGTRDAMTIKYSGNIGIGTVTPARKVHIHEDGSIANYLSFTNTTTGVTASSGFHIGIDASENAILNNYGNKNIEILCNGSERLRIKSTGHLKLPDDGKIEFGGAQDVAGDLQIYHAAGADSTIHHTATSGSTLRLRSRGFTFKNQANNGTIATLNEGDACKLFFNNAEKIATTTKGISVTGEVAASQDYPNFRPTLDLNFAAVKKLDPRITYQRTGPASFTDEFGKLIKVGDNEPRFDHNFATGESLGLLIEESSTNISRYSEKASGTTNWNQFGSISENVIEAPDGSMTADKLEAPSSGYGLINLAASWTANNAHTFSIFAKSAEWNRIGIRIYDGTSYYIRTNINLDTGEVVSGNNGAGTLRVDKFANGWWRISVTGTPVATYTYNSHICVEPHNTAIVQNADPSSSKEGIYIWGWQMEQKAFPTSYIPTNGAEVTRGVDIVKIDGTEFTDFYNQSEGTLLSEFTINDPADANSLTSGAIANINALSSDSYANSIMFMEIGTANGYFGRVYKSSNGTGLSYGSSVIADLMGGAGPDRVSFAWSDTVVDEGLASYWNGSVVNTSATETNTPTNMTELRIGRGWGSQYINAHIKRLSYYPKRLPDSQLATLTA